MTWWALVIASVVIGLNGVGRGRRGGETNDSTYTAAGMLLVLTSLVIAYAAGAQ